MCAWIAEKRGRIVAVVPRRSAEVLLLISVAAVTLSGAQFVYAVGAGFAPSNRPNILGGYLTDRITALTVDQEGAVYIAGSTYSPNFPAGATVPEHVGYTPEYLFVAKLTPDASRFVYAMMLPDQAARALALDRNGNAYVATTQFLGPFTRASSVLKIDPSGSRILYTANVPATVNALAIDGSGGVYVAGAVGTETAASAFVGKLSQDGSSLLYSKVLGPSGNEGAVSIAVDTAGFAYVTGSTNSSAFPTTTGAFGTQLPPSPPGSSSPGYTVFLTKLDPSGSKIIYSTFITGGSPSSAACVAIDVNGSAYVAGNSIGVEISAPKEALTIFGGNQAIGAFVVKVNPTGGAVEYAALFSGQAVSAIAVDGQRNAHITGSTLGGLAIFRPFQPSFYPVALPGWTASGTTTYSYSTASDAFVAALDPAGSKLVYSTYLNGYQYDGGLAVAADPKGDIYVGGYGALTLAATNPLSNDGSAFVVKLHPTGAPPLYTRESITNAASFGPGLVQQGGLTSIFVSSLTGISGSVQATGPILPTELAGVQVRINGIPAPLLSVSEIDGGQQINLQVLFEAAGQALDVEISQNGLKAWVPQVDVRSTAPGLFTLNGVRGAIQHAVDYSLVTVESPATTGETVVLYGTGFGPVMPPVASGKPVPASIFPTVLTPSVTIGGQPATVVFSGLVANLVGVYQINVRVPPNAGSGDQDVVVSFPPYTVCCIGAGSALRTTTVTRDGKPVKLAIR